jgi:NAD(P)-dependent dehydrogenase (short-subunit alcohol dehydrogenase family)
MVACELPITPSFRLDGRRALVTGAGRGIGLAAAAGLAQAGAEVTLCARTHEEIETAVAAIERQGGRAAALQLDVTDHRAVEASLQDKAPFDILVNNAGSNRPGAFLDAGLDDFDTVFNVNVRAVFNLTRLVAAKLIAAGRCGSIINVSSQLGHVGASERAIYVASKFAVEGLTKAIAVELGSRGIRVNAIAPTFIDTPLTRSYGLDATQLAALATKIKVGRIGRVEDLMGAVVFLASDASALVTGTSLLVDGGWTAD